VKQPPRTPEFDHFTTAVQDILKVSKGEMQTRIEAHKESGKRLSTRTDDLESLLPSHGQTGSQPRLAISGKALIELAE
jgi:hypothetical protein